MKTSVCRIALVAMVALVASTANAQLMMRWESTPMTIEGTNYFVNDLYVTGPGNVPTMEMLFDAGVADGIYQNQFGSNIPPSSAIVGAFPDAAFDSFAAVGQMTDGPTPIQPGAAVDIPGSSGVETFDGQNIDFAWASPGANPLPANDAFVMRLTLREDVGGGSEGGGFGQFFAAGVITDFAVVTPGCLAADCIPEPSSFGLIGLGLLGLVRRRR